MQCPTLLPVCPRSKQGLKKESHTAQMSQQKSYPYQKKEQFDPAGNLIKKNQTTNKQNIDI